MANNTVTAQFKDAALTLKVTPQITDAGTIILNLEVENNSPDFGRTSSTAIRRRSTRSRRRRIVLVKDGQTAVVGGIYQSTESGDPEPTPFLSQSRARLPVQADRHVDREHRAAAVHHAADREILGTWEEP